MTGLLQLYLACSVTMAAVTGVLLIASPILGRRYKAKTLYIAWLVVLLGFLVPLRAIPTRPALTVKMPAAISHPVFAYSNKAGAVQNGSAAIHSHTGAAVPEDGGVTLPLSGAAGNEVSNNHSGFGVPAAPVKPVTWASLAAIIWLLGASVSFLLMLVRHALFLRTVRRWQMPVTSPDVLGALDTEKRRLHIKRHVQLMFCPSVGSPMMIGLIRPRLLLPDEDLTVDELPLVIRHELTHLKRHDLWVRAVMLPAVSLHWFNPAVYAMSRVLGFWQESSCDENVTAAETQEGKQFYSETIIRVIRRQARMKSQMTTSFYGGKNGMKRRIMAILESGKKRAGVAVCLVTLAAVGSLGLAFAVGSAPEQKMEEAGLQTAYVTRADAEGAPMLFVPSANDLAIPIASYFNGVPVTIVEKRASSAPLEWGYKDGEENWANVLVGGDGTADGISGWIPLFYLSEAPAKLPVAKLTTGSPTGYVNVYTLNDTDSTLINTFGAGTQVTLLGCVQKWYQIELNGVYGFVQRENLSIDGATQKRFDTFLPTRFFDMDRTQYQQTLTFGRLYEEKAAEYGGKPVEYWSLEDKAWYGQMEETYLGSHDHYYQLPQEGDLQKDAAVDIAWNVFLADCHPQNTIRDDYDFNLGFFTIPDLEGDLKKWQVEISLKGATASFQVVMSSPEGAILEKGGAESYMMEAQGEMERAAYNRALEEWEKERGKPYYSWPLSDKAEFSRKYSDGRTILPDGKAISQEKAEELARGELQTRYGIAKEEMDAWKTGVDYSMYGTVSPYWRIEFHDASDNFLTSVTLDAYTGKVLDSSDPHQPGNG